MTNLSTQIEWTEATWSPIVGCTKVSEGCEYCYAERLVNGRLRRRHPGGFGQVRIHPERMNQPLRWRRPRRVFVNSLSDVFHEQIPDDWRVDMPAAGYREGVSLGRLGVEHRAGQEDHIEGSVQPQRLDRWTGGGRSARQRRWRASLASRSPTRR